MYLIIVWTFIYICLSKYYLLDAYSYVQGRIKVIHQSPELVHCVGSLFHKSEFKGFRVSEAGDKCEGLIGPLEDEGDLEQGYMYAELINRKMSFKPSSELQRNTDLTWDFPGTFIMGTRIDVYATWPEKEWEILTFTIFDSNWLGITYNQIEFSANGDTKFFSLREQYEKMTYKEIEDEITGTNFIISFVAGADNDLKILLDGNTLFTMQGEEITFDILNKVKIHYSALREEGSLFIQAIEFNEG